MVERNEAVAVFASAKLRMHVMSVLCNSADHEDLRIKTAESDIVSSVLR